MSLTTTIKKFLRLVTLTFVVLFALVTIVGKGGGGGGEDTTNQVPAAVAITASVDQDMALAIDIAAEAGNALGDEPSIVTATDPANGTTGVSGATITYTPDPGFSGADSFDYTITDADAETAMATVNVTVRDTAAPTATIRFPGAAGLTSGAEVLVTGTANDASTITSVKVAGVAATTTDGFATWRATAPLIQGDNLLQVETTDEFSNIDTAAATLMVESGPPIFIPRGITLDAGRALLVDDGLDAVVAVDLVSGERTILSDSTTPNTTNPFVSPVGITLDAANDRALVTDGGLAAVVAVDLASGERTILSDNLSPGSLFAFPTGITLDADNGRALVVNEGLDAVVAVDLASGARTILSNASIPDAANPFTSTWAITLDSEHNQALVTNYISLAIVAVDITTGARTILSE